MKIKIAEILFGSVCALFICVSPGAAEEKAARKGDILLETVTVTAQKREEDVQEIPASVSVLSEVAIEDANIQSTLDIQNYVPNLFIGSNGSRGYFSTINLRGVSNTGIGDPGVSLYIDDVPYSGLYIFNTPIFDLERIEVLKGPQGTLYGKNTEGGAINIVTKRPGNQTEGKVGAGFGDFERHQLYGKISFPLIEEELYLGLTAIEDSREGYVHNVTTGNSVDDEDTKFFRGGVVYTPSDRWDISANISWTKLEDGGWPRTPLEKSRYEEATGVDDLEDFEIGYDYEGASESENIFSAIRVSYEADSFDVLSVSGLRSNKNDQTLDGDFTPTPSYIGFNTHDTLAYTQELRFASKPEQTDFQWIVGLFYGDESKDMSTGYILDTVAADFYGVPVGTTDRMEGTHIARDGAVFGQSTLRFFEEAFGVTAGLRYDMAYRALDRTHTFGEVPVVDDIDKNKTFTKILPKFAIDYKFSEHIMAYGNYAIGYKAGGYSYAVDDPELSEFAPETNNAFEVGLKSEFPEMGLRVNLAAFYSLIEDYQDRVQVTQTTVIQANASSMKAYGVELESAYEFIPDWSLIANFGYLDAKYGDYPDPLNNINYDGNKVTMIPEYELGTILQYRSSLTGFMGQLEFRYLGKSYLNRANTIKQSSYPLANLKFGYETEQWDVYLSVENLTNKEYFVNALESPRLGNIGSVGPSRNIFLSGSFRF
jgi:iron complex outermembrane receptor protein